MSDRTDSIKKSLARGEVLNTENGCSVANVGSGDVRWLLAEAERLERELAEAQKHDVREMCITEAASWSNSIAEYCKHWEGRTEKAEREQAEARANADFLRESVGECHLMISRNTPEFQTKQNWSSTELPPRLQRIMRERDAARAEIEGERNERIRLSYQVDVMHANHAHTKGLLGKAEAEVERAFREGYASGAHDYNEALGPSGSGCINTDAAWSRYQQERK